jgi:aspartate aminotransferase-like enzyme/GNAT superfamily N-acetyltransferase
MLVFKVATEPWEFEEIHKLNYKTFVEEIPQHSPLPTQKLIDKFHQENNYIICTRGRTLIGMITVRGKRPFSLDQKLQNLDEYLPKDRRICEIRLLAVKPEARNGVIFKNLMEKTAEFCLGEGYDLAVISGTLRQLKLYKHIGFVPFGPVVGTADAPYQPMYLTLEAFRQTLSRFGNETKFLFDKKEEEFKEPVNLLPGPVEMHPSVRDAIAGPAVSTRAKGFVDSFERVKSLLLKLSGAKNVEIFLGSGTLANDVMTGQLSLIRGKGLIISEGEFGERLIDHAKRWRLKFVTLEKEWGKRVEKEEVEKELKKDEKIKWVLFTHCETSTGILHDLDGITEVCKRKKVKVAVDCISSFATVPFKLDKVDFATSLSGKAVGGFPGLSFVFYNGKVKPQPKKLPRYLDLGRYAEKHGIPYTTSSNLFAALAVALGNLDIEKKTSTIACLSSRLREEILKNGLQILVPKEIATPAVFTIVIPQEISSKMVGDELARRGYLVSYLSEYLLKRNWIQICLLGELRQEEILKLPAIIKDILNA